MTIDALDGHDGFNPAKGHAGCGVLPALYGLAQDLNPVSGPEFLLCLTLGYELACRTALAQHASVQSITPLALGWPWRSPAWPHA
jgi:2-methylcitrate dehydratase PrpD